MAIFVLKELTSYGFIHVEINSEHSTETSPLFRTLKYNFPIKILATQKL